MHHILKRIVSLISVAALVILLLPPGSIQAKIVPSGNNLVVNGDFSDDGESWEITSGGTRGDYTDGNIGLFLFKKDSPNAIQKNIAVLPDTSYELAIGLVRGLGRDQTYGNDMGTFVFQAYPHGETTTPIKEMNISFNGEAAHTGTMDFIVPTSVAAIDLKISLINNSGGNMDMGYGFVDHVSLFELKEQEPLLSHIKPTIYPYYTLPEEYPDFNRREHDVVTWDKLNTTPGKTLMTAGRNEIFAPGNYKDSIVPKGNVFRPDLTGIWDATHDESGNYNTSELQAVLTKMKENGDILHNIGGFGPGSPFGKKYGNVAGFGEYYVTPEVLQLILDSEVPFTGFDIGEQDGRYNFTFKNYQHPFPSDKVKQYDVTQSFFDKVAEVQGGYGSLLTVLWNWHMPVKEGYTMLAGSETQNKITNAQVQYSFLRGAGKQYGVLWYGDVSVFDPWGIKGGWGEDLGTGGPSLALLKREYFSQMMYNSTMLSFESGWTGSDGGLTQIGEINDNVYDLVNQHGTPGVMQTPVALLNDFYSGWMPAKQIANKFVTWNQIPYDKGDWMFDGMLSMIYPNYEESGFWHNETGARVDTPYGEIADCLLSDTTLETLKQYGVVVAAGDIFSGGKEFNQKIKEYITQGGNFVVTAENAKRIWPEWEIGNTITEPDGSMVQFKDGTSMTEPYAYERNSVGNLPSGAEIIAVTGNNEPLIVELQMGSGTVVLDLTPFGLNKNSLSYSDHNLSTYDTELGRPYMLTNHMRKILDERFASQQLFTVGDGLGQITNYKGDGEYTIAVYNNSEISRTFEIQSNIGEMISCTEIPTLDLTQDPLWGWKGTQYTGLSDQDHIFGGDLRLFQVKVDTTDQNKNAKLLNKSVPQKTYENRYFIPESFQNLREDVRTMPTFFEYFTGVQISWEELDKMSIEGLKESDPWRKRHGLQVRVDFSSNPSKTEDISIKAKMNAISNCTVAPTTEGQVVIDGRNRTWDEIYTAVQTSDSTITEEMDSENTGVVQKKNKKILLAMHNIYDVENEINEHTDFFTMFGGVKLDYEYLYYLDEQEVTEFKEYVNRKGLEVVVDFTNSVDHFIDLSLTDQVNENYIKSKGKIDNVFSKMEQIGLTDAIICSEALPEANGRGTDGVAAPWGEWGQGEANAKATWDRDIVNLATRAAEKGITLQLQNTTQVYCSSINDVKNFVSSKNQLKISLNGGYVNLVSGISVVGQPSSVIIAAPDAFSGSIQPFYKSQQSPAFLENVQGLKILDGGYNSWEEVQAEYDYIKNYVQESDDLLFNGSFDKDNSGWEVGADTTAGNTTDGIGNSQCAYIAVGFEETGYLYQNVELMAGKTYQLTGNSKINTDWANTTAAIAIYDGEEKIGEIVNKARTSSWKSMEVPSFTPATTKAYQIRIYGAKGAASGDSGGDGIKGLRYPAFDNIRLVTITP